MGNAIRAVPSHGTFPWESHSHGQAWRWLIVKFQDSDLQAGKS